jgi:hypothetical protein
VKDSAILSHEEQLAELARMYIRGHGGATVDYLAWWCGLGKTECRKGLALIESEIEKVEYSIVFVKNIFLLSINLYLKMYFFVDPE